MHILNEYKKSDTITIYNIEEYNSLINIISYVQKVRSKVVLKKKILRDYINDFIIE